MATDFPWQWTAGTSAQRADACPAFSMRDWDYLPPEADEVRVRLKVVSGRFQLSVGCVNLAFAPSDTFTDIQVVDERMGRWQTVRFSLHKHLIRSYRRNHLTKRLPYISLTRWIHEPLQLYLFRSGNGELLVDRVELVGCGLGRAYPQPTPNQAVPVSAVADFETMNDLASVFAFSTVRLNLQGPRPTNYMKNTPHASGTVMVAGKTIQWFLPPRPAWVSESTNGRSSLEVKQTGYESFAFTGLRFPHPDGANALQLTVRADHNSSFTNLVLDFLAYGAPAASQAAFPCTNCQPPAAWLADTNINFDLFLSESNTVKESYAMYHLRRTVPNGRWTRVLLPMDDFAAIYACNEVANILKSFQPLRSTSLLFLALFSPYK